MFETLMVILSVAWVLVIVIFSTFSPYKPNNHAISMWGSIQGKGWIFNVTICLTSVLLSSIVYHFVRNVSKTRRWMIMSLCIIAYGSLLTLGMFNCQRFFRTHMVSASIFFVSIPLLMGVVNNGSPVQMALNVLIITLPLFLYVLNLVGVAEIVFGVLLFLWHINLISHTPKA